MTKEQIEIINTSINNLRLLCKSMLNCIECPMNKNCNNHPEIWEDYKNDV